MAHESSVQGKKCSMVLSRTEQVTNIRGVRSGMKVRESSPRAKKEGVKGE